MFEREQRCEGVQAEVENGLVSVNSALVVALSGYVPELSEHLVVLDLGQVLLWVQLVTRVVEISPSASTFNA